MKDELTLGHAHVWLLRPEAAADPRLLGVYDQLLSGDERTLRDRSRSSEGRHVYLLTRALVRTTLSLYESVPPERWRFAANAHGRPELMDSQATHGLKFNVSHTRGLIACIVARDRDVGVDVEWTGRPGRLLDLADRYFSPAEAGALRGLPAKAQRERFFDYWTLKESFIKAVGVGVAFGLSRFSFSLGAEPIRIAFHPAIAEDPARWQFTLNRPSPEHALATSVRREPGENVAVIVRETIPLADTI